MIYKVQIMLDAEGGLAKEAFESTNYTHENTGAGNNFWSTNDSASPYITPHISAEWGRPAARARGNEINTDRRSNALLTCRFPVF